MIGMKGRGQIDTAINQGVHEARSWQGYHAN
jgi:hypothetical protein